MSGFMVYVKKGADNKLSSCIVDSALYTDSNGNYSFDLQPRESTFLLQKDQLNKAVFEKRTKLSKWLQADVDCMQAWWEKGLMSTITVGDDENIDQFKFSLSETMFYSL